MILSLSLSDLSLHKHTYPRAHTHILYYTSKLLSLDSRAIPSCWRSLETKLTSSLVPIYSKTRDLSSYLKHASCRDVTPTDTAKSAYMGVYTRNTKRVNVLYCIHKQTHRSGAARLHPIHAHTPIRHSSFSSPYLTCLQDHPRTLCLHLYKCVCVCMFVCVARTCD